MVRVKKYGSVSDLNPSDCLVSQLPQITRPNLLDRYPNTSFDSEYSTPRVRKIEHTSFVNGDDGHGLPNLEGGLPSPSVVVIKIVEPYVDVDVDVDAFEMQPFVGFCNAIMDGVIMTI